MIARLDSEVLRYKDLYTCTEQDLIYIWQVMHAHTSKNFHQDVYRTYFEALD